MYILIDINRLFSSYEVVFENSIQFSDSHITALIIVNQEYCHKICSNDMNSCANVRDVCAVRDNLKMLRSLR